MPTSSNYANNPTPEHVRNLEGLLAQAETTLAAAQATISSIGTNTSAAATSAANALSSAQAAALSASNTSTAETNARNSADSASASSTAAQTAAQNAQNTLTSISGYSSVASQAASNASASATAAQTAKVAAETARDQAQAAAAAGGLRGDVVQTLTDNQKSQMLINLGIKIPTAQCILKYSSPTLLRLDTKDGNKIFINGSYRTVPAGGVLVSNNGCTANTLYYVYAYWSATPSLGLMLSTAAPTWGTSFGVRVGSDESVTLVGMVYTNASVQFDPTLVRSYFNDPGVALKKDIASSTNSSVPTGLGNQYFLLWDDETLDISLNGSITQNSTVGNPGFYGYGQVGLDTGAVGQASKAGGQPSVHGTCASRWVGTPGVNGLRYATAYGWATSGVTATYDVALNVVVPRRR